MKHCWRGCSRRRTERRILLDPSSSSTVLLAEALQALAVAVGATARTSLARLALVASRMRWWRTERREAATAARQKEPAALLQCGTKGHHPHSCGSDSLLEPTRVDFRDSQRYPMRRKGCIHLLARPTAGEPRRCSTAPSGSLLGECQALVLQAELEWH